MPLFNEHDKSVNNQDANKSRYSPSKLLTTGKSNLQFNSFSGTDIQCFLFDVEGPAEAIKSASASEKLTEEEFQSIKNRVLNQFAVRPFGEIQTLSISISNPPGPVRRLGEREVVEYKMGARTVAGSMIFAVLNRDVFASYMQGTLAGSTTSSWHSPNYVDEIPEFNILVQGGNEFGAQASGLLIGVRLTNFGTTFSVDDLFTEATYNYVARHFIPFTDDWKNSLYDNLIGSLQSSPLSQKFINGGVMVEINGLNHRISRPVYEWWSALPEVARQNMKPLLPQLQNKLLTNANQKKLGNNQ